MVCEEVCELVMDELRVVLIVELLVEVAVTVSVVVGVLKAHVAKVPSMLAVMAALRLSTITLHPAGPGLMYPKRVATKLPSVSPLEIPRTAAFKAVITPFALAVGGTRSAERVAVSGARSSSPGLTPSLHVVSTVFRWSSWTAELSPAMTLT